jgi:hypothetical protein
VGVLILLGVGIGLGVVAGGGKFYGWYKNRNGNKKIENY